MAQFARDETGGFDDRVRIQLGTEGVREIQDYSVSVGVLQQPARFDLKLGLKSSERAADVIERYPPRTPFRLFIGDVQQQTGWTDGQPHVSGSATGATSIGIKGRDTLAPLHDGFVLDEITFRDETYRSLVEKTIANLFKGSDFVPKVLGSNTANRKIRAGVPIVELAPPRTATEILLNIGPSGFQNAGTAQIVQQAKLGERQLSLIRRFLDRAGLMLWAGADGNYILSSPNGAQKPVAHIERKRGAVAGLGGTGGAANIVSFSYGSDTVSRYSNVVIHGRGGGRKAGRSKSKGAEVDEEMLAWGYNKPLVVRDANTKNEEQARFLAARKLAEGRRHSWTLEYTVSGHTAPSLTGGGRAVWTPDTVVRIDDDEINLHGDFYLESCEYMRSDRTTTRLHFMRPDDLIFGGTDSGE